MARLFALIPVISVILISWSIDGSTASPHDSHADQEDQGTWLPSRKVLQAKQAQGSDATQPSEPDFRSEMSMMDGERPSCGFIDDPRSTAAITNRTADLVADIMSPLTRTSLISINIPTYFHIIMADPSGENPTDDQIAKQTTVLNQAYESTGFSFVLAQITRTINPQWSPLDVSNQAQTSMVRSALHVGGAADLNVYVVKLNSQGIIGVGSNPTSMSPLSSNPTVSSGVKNLSNDGTIIDIGTLPDGSKAGYNLGKNLVHESGHWNGLNHPFMGGCSEPNDGVDDTAEQAKPEYACFTNKPQPNTCPNRPATQPQVDPVTNYMGYSYDPCMDTFTLGQSVRMSASWSAYRAFAMAPPSAGGQLQGTQALKTLPPKVSATRRNPTKRRPSRSRGRSPRSAPRRSSATGRRSSDAAPRRSSDAAPRRPQP